MRESYEDRIKRLCNRLGVDPMKSDEISSEFMNMLDGFEKINIEETLRFKVMKALCDGLLKKGLLPSLIAIIVGRMTIDVDENFVDNTKLFNKTVEVYINLLSKMKAKVDEVNLFLFEEMMKGSEPLSIKFNVFQHLRCKMIELEKFKDNWDNMRIHISKFVRRQTLASGFSHWTHDDETLISMVKSSLMMGKCNAGYRKGVILVDVPPDGFFSSTVQLKAGDLLVGEYVARKEGEEPRKSTYVVGGEKMPAKKVYVVLYAHDVLVENNENDTDADYEIISVNASPTVEESPIPTGALIANHLQLSGGTATNLSDSEFVTMLRKSVEYWKDKSQVCPEDLYSKISDELKQRGIHE